MRARKSGEIGTGTRIVIIVVAFGLMYGLLVRVPVSKHVTSKAHGLLSESKQEATGKSITGWPDLETLYNYPNPFGDSCPAGGLTQSGNAQVGEKLRQNLLKNRFLLPKRILSMTPSELLQTPDEGDDTLESQGVSIVVWVSTVKTAGAELREPEGKSGESCNCHAHDSSTCDAHIEFYKSQDSIGELGKGMFIAEVTERGRRLAAKGLLKSNGFTSPNDWSTSHLRDVLENHWVKLTGWLFFDKDHLNQSWGRDPSDTDGLANWRQSCWEIHPVMGIEVVG